MNNSKETSNDEVKSCPYCGETILEVAKKCKHCEEFLDQQSYPLSAGYQDSITNQSVEPDNKSNIGMVFFVIIIISIIAVIVVLIDGKPDTEKYEDSSISTEEETKRKEFLTSVKPFYESAMEMSIRIEVGIDYIDYKKCFIKLKDSFNKIITSPDELSEMVVSWATLTIHGHRYCHSVWGAYIEKGELGEILYKETKDVSLRRAYIENEFFLECYKIARNSTSSDDVSIFDDLWKRRGSKMKPYNKYLGEINNYNKKMLEMYKEKYQKN